MQEIRKNLDAKTLVIGYDAVIKGIRKGTIKKVFYATNLPEDKLEEINKYASFTKIPVESAKVSNEELGVICKKSFLISIVGIKK